MKKKIEAYLIRAFDLVQAKLSHPMHPVAIAMERRKTMPEVRIIEGSP
jgi:hypothetical protein